MQSQATVQTPHARRYLGQFCKHFAHKLPVELAETNETGEVTFGTGVCALRADDHALRLSVIASRVEDITQFQDVVDRHLVRFAFREPLTLTWQPLEDGYPSPNHPTLSQ